MIKIPKFEGIEYEKLSSYQEITDYLLNTICEVHELGLSSNSDMIYGLSVGDLSKPMIFIDGTMHGAHEWRCTHFVKEFIERIAQPVNDGNKILINEIKSEFCFMVIPCLNTYGYLNNSYNNANGVNLNRNFPVGWDSYPDEEPGHSQYKGSSPFSEPESQIVKNIVDTYRVVGYVNCHTWGGYLGGIFETSSAEVEYRALLDDAKKSVEISSRFDMTIRYRNTPSTPWVTEWVGRESSKCGRDIVSVIFEVGSEETDFDKSILGMTGLLIFSKHVYEWFKTRNLTLN